MKRGVQICWYVFGNTDRYILLFCYICCYLLLCYYIVICCLILYKTLQKPSISIENNYMRILQLKRLKVNKLFFFV